jgi:hypothetical protein
MKKTIYILIFLSLFEGCKKDPSINTSVEGMIIDATTSKPIANATVYLLSGSSSILSGSRGVQAAYPADGNGHFSFEFKSNNSLIYSLAASEKKYFDNIGTSTIYLTKNRGNNNNIKLTPRAFLKIHIKSVNNNDYIHLGAPCVIGCAFGGQNLDTTLSYNAYGNKNNPIDWL